MSNTPLPNLARALVVEQASLPRLALDPKIREFRKILEANGTIPRLDDPEENSELEKKLLGEFEFQQAWANSNHENISPDSIEMRDWIRNTAEINPDVFKHNLTPSNSLPAIEELVKLEPDEIVKHLEKFEFNSVIEQTAPIILNPPTVDQFMFAESILGTDNLESYFVEGLEQDSDGEADLIDDLPPPNLDSMSPNMRAKFIRAQQALLDTPTPKDFLHYPLEDTPSPQLDALNSLSGNQSFGFSLEMGELWPQFERFLKNSNADKKTIKLVKTLFQGKIDSSFGLKEKDLKTESVEKPFLLKSRSQINAEIMYLRSLRDLILRPTNKFDIREIDQVEFFRMLQGDEFIKTVVTNIDPDQKSAVVQRLTDIINLKRKILDSHYSTHTGSSGGKTAIPVGNLDAMYSILKDEIALFCDHPSVFGPISQIIEDIQLSLTEDGTENSALVVPDKSTIDSVLNNLESKVVDLSQNLEARRLKLIRNILTFVEDDIEPVDDDYAIDQFPLESYKKYYTPHHKTTESEMAQFLDVLDAGEAPRFVLKGSKEAESPSILDDHILDENDDGVEEGNEASAQSSNLDDEESLDDVDGDVISGDACAEKVYQQQLDDLHVSEMEDYFSTNLPDQDQDFSIGQNEVETFFDENALQFYQKYIKNETMDQIKEINDINQSQYFFSDDPEILYLTDFVQSMTNALKECKDTSVDYVNLYPLLSALRRYRTVYTSLFSPTFLTLCTHLESKHFQNLINPLPVGPSVADDKQFDPQTMDPVQARSSANQARIDAGKHYNFLTKILKLNESVSELILPLNDIAPPRDDELMDNFADFFEQDWSSVDGFDNLSPETQSFLRNPLLLLSTTVDPNENRDSDPFEFLELSKHLSRNPDSPFPNSIAGSPFEYLPSPNDIKELYKNSDYSLESHKGDPRVVLIQNEDPVVPAQSYKPLPKSVQEAEAFVQESTANDHQPLYSIGHMFISKIGSYALQAPKPVQQFYDEFQNQAAQLMDGSRAVQRNLHRGHSEQEHIAHFQEYNRPSKQRSWPLITKQKQLEILRKGHNHFLADISSMKQDAVTDVDTAVDTTGKEVVNDSNESTESKNESDSESISVTQEEIDEETKSQTEIDDDDDDSDPLSKFSPPSTSQKNNQSSENPTLNQLEQMRLEQEKLKPRPPLKTLKNVYLTQDNSPLATSQWLRKSKNQNQPLATRYIQQNKYPFEKFFNDRMIRVHSGQQKGIQVPWDLHSDESIIPDLLVPAELDPKAEQIDPEQTYFDEDSPGFVPFVQDLAYQETPETSMSGSLLGTFDHLGEIGDSLIGNAKDIATIQDRIGLFEYPAFESDWDDDTDTGVPHRTSLFATGSFYRNTIQPNAENWKTFVEPEITVETKLDDLISNRKFYHDLVMRYQFEKHVDSNIFAPPAINPLDDSPINVNCAQDIELLDYAVPAPGKWVSQVNWYKSPKIVDKYLSQVRKYRRLHQNTLNPTFEFKRYPLESYLERKDEEARFLVEYGSKEATQDLTQVLHELFMQTEVLNPPLENSIPFLTFPGESTPRPPESVDYEVSPDSSTPTEDMMPNTDHDFNRDELIADAQQSPYVLRLDMNPPPQGPGVRLADAPEDISVSDAPDTTTMDLGQDGDINQATHLFHEGLEDWLNENKSHDLYPSHTQVASEKVFSLERILHSSDPFFDPTSGTIRPFKDNPQYTYPLRIPESVRSYIYTLHKTCPELWTVERLSIRFKVRRERIMAILRLEQKKSFKKLIQPGLDSGRLEWLNNIANTLSGMQGATHLYPGWWNPETIKQRAILEGNSTKDTWEAYSRYKKDPNSVSWPQFNFSPEEVTSSSQLLSSNVLPFTDKNSELLIDSSRPGDSVEIQTQSDFVDEDGDDGQINTVISEPDFDTQSLKKMIESPQLQEFIDPDSSMAERIASLTLKDQATQFHPFASFDHFTQLQVDSKNLVKTAPAIVFEEFEFWPWQYWQKVFSWANHHQIQSKHGYSDRQETAGASNVAAAISTGQLTSFQSIVDDSLNETPEEPIIQNEDGIPITHIQPSNSDAFDFNNSNFFETILKNPHHFDLSDSHQQDTWSSVSLESIVQFIQGVPESQWTEFSDAIEFFFGTTDPEQLIYHIKGSWIENQDFLNTLDPEIRKQYLAENNLEELIKFDVEEQQEKIKSRSSEQKEPSEQDLKDLEKENINREIQNQLFSVLATRDVLVLPDLPNPEPEMSLGFVYGRDNSMEESMAAFDEAKNQISLNDSLGEPLPDLYRYTGVDPRDLPAPAANFPEWLYFLTGKLPETQNLDILDLESRLSSDIQSVDIEHDSDNELEELLARVDDTNQKIDWDSSESYGPIELADDIFFNSKYLEDLIAQPLADIDETWKEFLDESNNNQSIQDSLLEQGGAPPVGIYHEHPPEDMDELVNMNFFEQEYQDREMKELSELPKMILESQSRSDDSYPFLTPEQEAMFAASNAKAKSAGKGKGKGKSSKSESNLNPDSEPEPTITASPDTQDQSESETAIETPAKNDSSLKSSQDSDQADPADPVDPAQLSFSENFTFPEPDEILLELFEIAKHGNELESEIIEEAAQDGIIDHEDFEFFSNDAPHPDLSYANFPLDNFELIDHPLYAFPPNLVPRHIHFDQVSTKLNHIGSEHHNIFDALNLPKNTIPTQQQILDAIEKNIETSTASSLAGLPDLKLLETLPKPLEEIQQDRKKIAQQREKVLVNYVNSQRKQALSRLKDIKKVNFYRLNPETVQSQLSQDYVDNIQEWRDRLEFLGIRISKDELNRKRKLPRRERTFTVVEIAQDKKHPISAFKNNAYLDPKSQDPKDWPEMSVYDPRRGRKIRPPTMEERQKIHRWMSPPQYGRKWTRKLKNSLEHEKRQQFPDYASKKWNVPSVLPRISSKKVAPEIAPKTK